MGKACELPSGDPRNKDLDRFAGEWVGEIIFLRLLTHQGLNLFILAILFFFFFMVWLCEGFFFLSPEQKLS